MRLADAHTNHSQYKHHGLLHFQKRRKQLLTAVATELQTYANEQSGWHG